MQMESPDNKGCWPVAFVDIKIIIRIVINDYLKRIQKEYQ